MGKDISIRDGGWLTTLVTGRAGTPCRFASGGGGGGGRKSAGKRGKGLLRLGVRSDASDRVKEIVGSP